MKKELEALRKEIELLRLEIQVLKLSQPVIIPQPQYPIYPQVAISPTIQPYSSDWYRITCGYNINSGQQIK